MRLSDIGFILPKTKRQSCLGTASRKSGLYRYIHYNATIAVWFQPTLCFVVQSSRRTGGIRLSASPTSWEADGALRRGGTLVPDVVYSDAESPRLLATKSQFTSSQNESM